ncbi:hypothetical protein GGTG_10215 [Gaeumannomyces tritici R3-111a-1]|uniref:Uncharacterized protein n=1 Tax=Gaeumannomyces tritici (strain R3-111a-1) TaxID=644352 RepID=J3P9N8_GAET3|nr:hypothetical protein GGTG_10215 [Gaeumannomyces tritici R3-111a-1]EJT73374.1 hypothetical protein GGTG_10215 [Gaeumannomyces tritici R3-111a-1]
MQISRFFNSLFLACLVTAPAALAQEQNDQRLVARHFGNDGPGTAAAARAIPLAQRGLFDKPAKKPAASPAKPPASPAKPPASPAKPPASPAKPPANAPARKPKKNVCKIKQPGKPGKPGRRSLAKRAVKAVAEGTTMTGTNADELRTWSLKNCVGLAAYDCDTGAKVMAHINGVNSRGQDYRAQTVAFISQASLISDTVTLRKPNSADFKDDTTAANCAKIAGMAIDIRVQLETAGFNVVEENRKIKDAPPNWKHGSGVGRGGLRSNAGEMHWATDPAKYSRQKGAFEVALSCRWSQ